MTEPTLKQWKRRALKAEEELMTIRRMRAFDAKQEMELARQNAVMRVYLQEIQEASNWADDAISDKLETI